MGRRCFIIAKPAPWLGCMDRGKGGPCMPKGSTLKMPWSYRPRPVLGAPVSQTLETAGSYQLVPTGIFFRVGIRQARSSRATEVKELESAPLGRWSGHSRTEKGVIGNKEENKRTELVQRVSGALSWSRQVSVKGYEAEQIAGPPHASSLSCLAHGWSPSFISPVPGRRHWR